LFPGRRKETKKILKKEKENGLDFGVILEKK